MLSFPYLDYRDKLKRTSWSIGTRSRTRYLTLHYNGPAVGAFGNPQGEIKQLQFDATWHIGSYLNADGIQYHGATLSDGTNLQLRDWQAKLWHCGNYVGNNESIAWTVVFGGMQRATEAQLDSLFNVVLPAFQREYGIFVVNVKGHREWKKTLCPGTLYSSLLEWRDNHQVDSHLMWFETLVNVNVREAPDVRSPIALNGTATVPKGTTFAVNKIIKGIPYNGIDTYIHRADQLGFMLNSNQLVRQIA